MSFPITPEMVVDAYEKTGLTPKRYTLCDGSWACGMGAVLALRYGKDLAVRVYHQTTHEEANLLGLSRDQSNGFANGFDGVSPSEYEGPEPEAYAAGRKAAQLVGLIPND